MLKLKPLSRESVPEALKKAEHYRLLNEPLESESICRDILGIEPQNQKALIVLLLSLTDQVAGNRPGMAKEARKVLAGIEGEYERAYYAGIICERQGKALIRAHKPHSEYRAYELLREALEWYEKAEHVRPPANDDPILRWNTCVRVLESHPNIRPEPEGEREITMLE